MADISAWSPVDESNTSAPPHGWPEAMQPSAVNNSARALMGGVRRWYDTITAQITSINANFGNYLPLSGGTLTGTLTGTTIQGSQLTSTGNINALSIVNATLDVSANRNLIAAGNCTVGFDVVANRNISAAGSIYATGEIVTDARVNASFYDCDGVRVIDTTGGSIPLIYKAGNVWGIQLQGVATFYENNTHYFRNSGSSSTFTIDSAGNVDAAAQVQGASIYSRGGISAASTISASGNISTNGGMYAEGSVDGAYINSRGNANIAGTGTFNHINMAGSGPPKISINGYIIPYADHGFNCGLPGSNADSMHAYAFVVPSDERLKADIKTPEECLPLVRAIQPRTYRLPGAPDPNATRWGFIAQQVGEVMRLNNREFAGHRIDTNPETGKEHQGLDTHQLVAVLWAATQELAAKVAALEAAR